MLAKCPTPQYGVLCLDKRKLLPCSNDVRRPWLAQLFTSTWSEIEIPYVLRNVTSWRALLISFLPITGRSIDECLLNLDLL
jgi:hypothetical protein